MTKEKQVSKQKVVNRVLEGVELKLKVGSRRKQLLSNSFEITVDSGGNVASKQRLTLRQAKALQRFLNENLPK